jgi:mono/diheme cytochrome c family protein
MSTQGFTRGLRLFSFASVLTCLAACGSEHGADQWPIARGELAGNAPMQGAKTPEGNYRQYCIGCHGADGRGNGGTTGADFTGPQSPLRARTDGELIASVRDGKRGVAATMPAHSPVLNDAQIADVVGYLRSRFQQVEAGSPTGERN